MFMTRKARTQTETMIIIGVVLVVAIGGVWFLTRPGPTPPAENKAPVIIVAQNAHNAFTGETVGFSADGSIDSDGTIEEYIWYFGDGETGDGESVTHSYDLPGFYTVYVEAVDDDDAKSDSLRDPLFLTIKRTALTEVSLESPPVSLIAASKSLTEVNEAVTFDGSSSFHFRERNEEIQGYTGNVESWSWDFGDGETAEGKVVEHAYANPGSYMATLTVTDKLVGKTNIAGRTVVVTPDVVEYEGVIKNPDTITVRYNQPLPSHIDLLEASEVGVGRWMCLALSDMLLFYQPGAVEPTTEGGLAETYEISSDKKTYTFKLREGIKFWDGTELKAEDVVYTWRRSIKLMVGKVWGALVGEAITGIPFGETVTDSALEEHIYATDDYTVVFELPRPYGPFLSSMAYTGRGIIQKKAAIDAGSWYMGDTRDWAMVRDPMMEDVNGIIAGEGLQCTGAYKIKEWSKGERVLVERNEDYWKGPAPTKYIEGVYVAEHSTAYMMLAQGDIDMTGVSAAQAETFMALPEEAGITITPTKFTGFLTIIYFGINFDEAGAPPGNDVPSDFFNDIHMRKAFAYIFPYERYIQEVHLGWADPAKGFLIPGWPGYEECYPYEYNPEKAIEEFKLAHDGKYWEEGFTLGYAYQAWAAGNHDMMGQLLAEELEKINPKFKVVISVKRWPDILDGATPMTPMSVENGPDPYYLTNIFHSQYGYAGYFGFDNEEIDSLLEQAQWEPSAEAMSTCYADAQALTVEDMPGILTNYNAGFNAARSYISGWQHSIAWMCTPGWVYLLEKN